ncbi:MAG: acetyl-CoA C-acyltransferase, partial [Chlamydiia bacterium]|nr:acetyl-CoA C-acyltransferase [Chlamydiia bacterium]
LKELIQRMSIPIDMVEEVVMGNVSQPADAANVARVAALRAGIPDACPAHTVHRNCASGMQALTTAANKILAGEISIA